MRWTSFSDFTSSISDRFSKSEDESPAESQSRLASSSRSSGGSGKETDEGRADIARSSEVRQLRKEVDGLKGRVHRRDVSIRTLKGKEEQLTNRIEELEHKVGLHQEVEQRRTQHIWAVEERLKRTEELLATRSAELAGAQAFLSTTDHLSEEEVLGIVRDLNENIYQIAVDLTEGWEKLESSRTASPMDVDPASRPNTSALVQLACNRDPVGLTFLLQSCLCSQVARMTSSWGQNQELAVLESIHQQLSASGEHHSRRQVTCNSHVIAGQAISARWRSLAHSHLSRPPPHPTLLMEELASVLDHTGSFSSTRRSLDFVRSVALDGIETIIQLALRLESTFKVEVTSSDMSLLFEAAGTVFDDTTMTNDIGSNGVSTPGRQDRIAGTTEVGIRKSVLEAGKSRRAEILLKTKVVLERDVMMGP